MTEKEEVPIVTLTETEADEDNWKVEKSEEIFELCNQVNDYNISSPTSG